MCRVGRSTETNRPCELLAVAGDSFGGNCEFKYSFTFSKREACGVALAAGAVMVMPLRDDEGGSLDRKESPLESDGRCLGIGTGAEGFFGVRAEEVKLESEGRVSLLPSRD